jgi:rod shape-determining protein MreC
MFRRNGFVVLSIVLILLSLVIISIHRRDLSTVDPLEEVLLDMAHPIQLAVAKGLYWMRSVWEGYIWLVQVEKENERLRRRLRELERMLTDYEEVEAFNRRLRKLLDFQLQEAYKTLPAQVVGEDTTGWFQTLWIDKGRSNGVRKGMAVVASNGVVGRTIKSALRTSKVLLISDRNSALDVMIQRSRTRGILVGTGQLDVFELKYVPRTADVMVGDRVITSGLGGIFPKGILVGRVKSVWSEGYGLFKKVEVTPEVDFARLEEVLVILGQPRMKANLDH